MLSANPCFGRSLFVPRGTFVAGFQREVFSYDARAGDAPTYRTVQLGRGFRPDTGSRSADVSNVMPRALVTWGVGGMQSSFLCDWGQGVEFGLLFDAIRIELLADVGSVGAVSFADPVVPVNPPAPIVPYAEDTSWTAAVSLDRGPSRPIYYTAPVCFSDAVGVGIQLDVPQFAVEVFPYCSGLWDGGAPSLFQFAETGVFLSYTLNSPSNLSGGQLPAWFPVPGNARWCRFISGSDGFNSLQPVFRLAV